MSVYMCTEGGRGRERERRREGEGGREGGGGRGMEGRRGRGTYAIFYIEGGSRDTP